MKRLFVFFQLLVFSIPAQTITVSKDSLKVYNNPVMSMMDGIVFRNTGSGLTFLDSAKITFDQLDTSGGFSWDTSKVKVMLDETYRGGDMGIDPISLRKVDSNTYMLVSIYRMKSAQAAFTMYPLGDSTTLSNLQIVNCMTCTPPHYPKYIKGDLRMFFHGGQTVAIRLYSQDLRKTGTLSPPPPGRHDASAPSSGLRVFLNGQKIPVGTAMKNRHGIHNLVCDPNGK